MSCRGLQRGKTVSFHFKKKTYIFIGQTLKSVWTTYILKGQTFKKKSFRELSRATERENREFPALYRQCQKLIIVFVPIMFLILKFFK